MKYLSLLLFTPFWVVLGQETSDCENLWKKEISVSDLTDRDGRFFDDFEQLMRCSGFDDVDFQIFMRLDTSTIISAKIIDQLSNNSNEKFTFKDLENTLHELQQHPNYSKAREIVKAKNEIDQRIATAATWNADKQLLLQMGFENAQLDDIHTIVR